MFEIVFLTLMAIMISLIAAIGVRLLIALTLYLIEELILTHRRLIFTLRNS